MMILSALRDFAEGLARGLSLYIPARNDNTARAFAPGLRQTRPR
jgi:hypothetical protein